MRGVDIKEPEYEGTAAQEFELLDLTKWKNCLQATRGIDHVYGLAANMGGIGFIESIGAYLSLDCRSVEGARSSSSSHRLSFTLHVRDKAARKRRKTTTSLCVCIF